MRTSNRTFLDENKEVGAVEEEAEAVDVDEDVDVGGVVKVNKYSQIETSFFWCSNCL